VIGNAELISAIVLMQLAAPGAPVFYSLCASVMDPQTAGYIIGISEKYLCNAAGIQLAHDWSVPALAGAFAMDSPEPNTWKLGRDSVYTSLLAALAGADLAEGLGMIKSSTLLVPEQIIFDDEIYHTHRRLVEGVDTSTDGLAMDAIKNVGPGGHFLGQKHTRKYLREIWIPELSYPRFSKGETPSPEIRQRAREKFDKILKEHQPEPLEEAIQRELEKILDTATKEIERQET
jgi:trimethylamine--corrinoid protein Co-methyltransferase